MYTTNDMFAMPDGRLIKLNQQQADHLNEQEKAKAAPPPKTPDEEILSTPRRISPSMALYDSYIAFLPECGQEKAYDLALQSVAFLREKKFLP